MREGNDGRRGNAMEPVGEQRQRPGLGRQALESVPNGLTLARVGLAAAFPFVPVSWRLPVFLAATATEALDGPIARRLGATSIFGQLLDPIADKVFVLAVLGTLLVDGTLAWWMIPLVAARDLMVVAGGITVALRQGRSALTRMPPTRLGKAATGAQFLFLLWLVAGLGPEVPAITSALFALTAVLSVSAGTDYLRRFPTT